MRGGLIAGLVILAVVVVAYGTFTGTYNRLVQANQVVNAAQAEVETQLQRRYDLIPNLVASARGVLTQERTVFDDLARAREHYAGSPAGSPERVGAANQVETALGRLLVIVENYPVLRSNETVQGLMSELSGTENQVAYARRQYNGAVAAYNTMVQSFPTNLIAGGAGFHPRPYFQAQPGSEQAPRVDLTVPAPAKP